MNQFRWRRVHRKWILLSCFATSYFIFFLSQTFLHCTQKLCGNIFQETWLPVPPNILKQTSYHNIDKEIVMKLNTTVIKYPSFSVQLPNFVDEYDERLFWSNYDNKMQSQRASRKQLLGQIKIHRNGAIHSGQDCGWTTNESFSDIISPKIRRRKLIDILCPILVPQSNNFHHFIDGVLPKIMQVFHILNNTNIKLMIHRPWDRIIEEIFIKIGISLDRLIFYDSGYYQAEFVINTCGTPPLHPSLWNMMRKQIGVNVNNPVKNSMGYVILISREGSRNYGRNLKNEEEVILYLQRKYQDTFMVFHKPLNLHNTMELFQNARILIGVHGGGLYNLLFCPQDTNIVEIMPTVNNGDVVPNSLAHTIIWKMSGLIGQGYWRITAEPENKFGDIILDVNKLKKVMNKIDDEYL